MGSQEMMHHPKATIMRDSIGKKGYWQRKLATLFVEFGTFPPVGNKKFLPVDQYYVLEMGS